MMERQDWIDRHKGLLIILVVMGHVVGGACHLTTGTSASFLHYCYITIYSFHMPAFFFLAGITWKQREDETFGSFFIKKAKRLLVPYFIFGILSSIAFCVMSHSFGNSVENQATTSYYAGKYTSSFTTCLLGLLHAGGYPNGEGFRMNSVLWFLPCLFSVELVYWWVRRWKLVGLRALPVVLLCVWGAILVPRFFPGLPWGGSSVPWYLLFLIFGAECFSLQPFGLLEKRGSRCLLMGCVAGFVAVCCLVPDPIQAYRDWRWWPLYAALALVGCVLSAWTAQVVKAKWWSVCGLASMGIMLTHKFPVLFFELKVPFVRVGLETNLWCAALTSVFLVVVITVGCLSLTQVIRWCVPWSLGEKIESSQLKWWGMVRRRQR